VASTEDPKSRGQDTPHLKDAGCIRPLLYRTILLCSDGESKGARHSLNIECAEKKARHSLHTEYTSVYYVYHTVVAARERSRAAEPASQTRP
jgi:hypothetical protein